MRARRPRRLHAAADAGVPRPLPTRSSTSIPRSCPLPGPARDRAGARRGRRGDRRHRPLVDEGVDTGPVLRQEPVPVEPRDDAGGADPRGRAPAAAGGGERALRALISVYDKSGLDEFARGLDELGWELVASGGTAAYLEEHGLPVTRVETPDRVRRDARPPRRHAASGRPRRDPRAARRPRGPRRSRRARDRAVRPGRRQPLPVRRGRLAARRDRGGGGRDDRHRRPGAAPRRGEELPPRRAVARPEQYERVLAELREHGALSLDTRRSLAAEAFVVTAAYESAIAAWFSERETFPEGLIPTFWKDAEPRLRREPAPARRVLRRGGRAAPPALARRAAARTRALVQQPQRPLGRAAARRGVHAAGLRDRQAREPVRSRRGGRDRGRVRAGGRLRSGVGVRRAWSS